MGIAIGSIFRGPTFFFAGALDGAGFFPALAVLLPAPGLGCFAGRDVGFFFWVFLPIDVFMGICIVLFL
jgi:hypothetical protein